MKNTNHNKKGFTLVELLIAIGIFGTITVLVSSLFVDAFRQSQRVALQNSLYEDARYIMDQITEEIQNNAIDYDEYYNQYVVIPSNVAGTDVRPTYGQNFGRYFSAFFNPGSDNRLGFTCNADGNGDGQLDRNQPDCTPQRRTLDRATGQNPFSGKVDVAELGSLENALCGTVRAILPAAPLNNRSLLPGGICLQGSAPTQMQVGLLPELYLIKHDGSQKTILARERIGGAQNEPYWALSRLRLSGADSNNDGTYDDFACAEGYSCGSNACPLSALNLPDGLPRGRAEELTPTDQLFADACDNRENGFVHDFVPVSPLRVDVQQLGFVITPLEDPLYAFAETDMQAQPRVTIVMTVRPNPEYLQNKNAFEPFTMVKTVTSRSTQPVKAPLLVE